MRSFFIVMGLGLVALQILFFTQMQRVDQYNITSNVVAAGKSIAVGKVASVEGDASIVREPSQKIHIEKGLPIYSDDTIETTATGIVSILFIDNTSFTVSENARLSVNQFTYDPADHKGTSFFSVARGLFVYTSGLIGKENPANVNIDIPMGSIGIRGTVIAGDIRPEEKDSKITVVDGAATITNGGGTIELKDKLQTVLLVDYKTVPTDIGPMDQQVFDNAYQAVAIADKKTFDEIVRDEMVKSDPVAEKNVDKDKTDAVKEKSATLIVDIDGHSYSGTGLGKNNSDSMSLGAILGSSGIVGNLKKIQSQSVETDNVLEIASGKEVQLKVEIVDDAGQKVDVTKDKRTIYQVLTGTQVSVSSAGLLKTYKDPLPGGEETGIANEATVLILYGDVNAKNILDPANIVSSVLIKFKIE